MQTVEPRHRKNKTGSHIFINLPKQKRHKTPYCNSYFFLPGVAEHRIAKSPGLKGCGLFYLFSCQFKFAGLSSIRIMLPVSAFSCSLSLLQYLSPYFASAVKVSTCVCWACAW